MIVRNATIEELSKLRKMHADMGMKYPFPDLMDELTVLIQVAVSKDEKIVAGGVVRVIGEAYLFIDPSCPLGDKLEAIGELNTKMSEKAKEDGFSEISAWIPPEAHGPFTHLMEARGWIKSPWPNWTKLL